MNLSNDIFSQFFMNKISREKLLNEIGSDSPQFEEKLKEEMEDTILRKDGKRLEYLIYTLF